MTERDNHSEQPQQPIPDQPESFITRLRRNDYLIRAIPLQIRLATYVVENMLIFYIAQQAGASVEEASGIGLVATIGTLFLAERYLVPRLEGRRLDLKKRK